MFTRKSYAGLTNVDQLERHDEKHTRYNKIFPDASGTLTFSKHKNAGWVEIRCATQTPGKNGRGNAISFTMSREEALQLRDYLNEIE